MASLLVVRQVKVNPRTDDAEVFANYIGMAPLVNGPVTHLYVADNQLVKPGIRSSISTSAPMPTLSPAQVRPAGARGEISDERRIIAAKSSGVDVAKASILSAEASVPAPPLPSSRPRPMLPMPRLPSSAPMQSSRMPRTICIGLSRCSPASLSPSTRWTRRAPCRFRVRRLQVSPNRNWHWLRQAFAAEAQYRQAQAQLEQSHQQVQQATHNVTTLEPLEGQIPGKQAAIDTAKYNFDNCRIAAPFDARVTNLTISQGAYATAGQHIFTLIDTRTWWVVANFRETQLRHIRPGMVADVYVMSRPSVRYKGVVDSVGFGVTPDSDIVGHIAAPGLPDVQRTLNWVHLASRFPVRVRIQRAARGIPPRRISRHHHPRTAHPNTRE